MSLETTKTGKMTLNLEKLQKPQPKATVYQVIKPVFERADSPDVSSINLAQSGLKDRSMHEQIEHGEKLLAKLKGREDKENVNIRNMLEANNAFKNSHTANNTPMPQDC